MPFFNEPTSTQRAPKITSARAHRSEPKFKIPERIEIMADFPLSAFGKVSKKKLAEMVASK